MPRFFESPARRREHDLAIRRGSLHGARAMANLSRRPALPMLSRAHASRARSWTKNWTKIWTKNAKKEYNFF